MQDRQTIDFAAENVFLLVWGGGGITQEWFLNFGNNRFFKQRNYREILSVRKNVIGNINVGQTSRLNLDKFGISNNIPDCRSPPFV